MNKPIRIYGRLRKIGDDYYEAEYKDYRPDGTVFGYGFEDFSGERLEAQTKKYEVHVYNGKTMHGAVREGWRMTDIVGNVMRVSVKTNGLTAARILHKNKDVARVQRVRDRKSTRLNSSHPTTSRMPSSA